MTQNDSYQKKKKNDFNYLIMMWCPKIYLNFKIILKVIFTFVANYSSKSLRVFFFNVSKKLSKFSTSLLIF